jgi:hypothetical protein
MSVPPVQLFLDSFLVGLLPKDGETVTKDVVLKGTDGTIITVVTNSGTTYKEQPQKVFEAIPNQSALYKFQFPVGTISNGDSTKFTTTDNSVYTFSSGNDSGKFNDAYYMNVKSGTIKISPPNVTANVAQEGATFVNNAILNESSLGDSAFGNLKDNPFYKILMILYDLLMDMVVIVIFWLLFISIGCWLKVKPEFLYPSDTTVYPYQYYEDISRNVTYNYLKHNSDDKTSCTQLSTKEVEYFKGKQNDLFAELKEYKNGPNHEILNILYPELLEMDSGGVKPESQTLKGLCSKSEFGIMECVTYTLNLIRFHSYVSCNSVLSSIHGAFAVISNDILSKIVPYKMWGMSAISVLFAVFLYFLLLHSGTYTEQIIEMFSITFSDSTDPQTIMINQFKHLIVYVLTCCMLIFVPLFFLLFMSAAGTTFYVLCKQLFDNFNGFILCIAVISLYFAMINYATLLLIVSGTIPIDTIMEGSGGAFMGMSAIFSIFSVGVPLLVSGGLAGYISYKLFTSSFSFIPLESMADTMKNCLSSLVIVSLFILVKRVGDKLGEVYSAITIMIIILMGILFASGNG